MAGSKVRGMDQQRALGNFVLGSILQPLPELAPTTRHTTPRSLMFDHVVQAIDAGLAFAFLEGNKAASSYAQ